jgi:hypothetical protein
MIPDPFQTFSMFHRLLTAAGVLFLADKQYHCSALYPGHKVLGRENAAFYASYPFICNLLTLTGFEVVLYKNVFGEFKLIARKSPGRGAAWQGSFLLELLILKTLPLMDFVFDGLQRAVVGMPTPIRNTLKPMAKKGKLLP